MLLHEEQAQIDERTMELIAARVTAALREDLETILAGLGHTVAPTPTLTVEQVARHLGVSRSTVYSHWREWGGYKLGSGEKAPIRFDGNNRLSCRVGGESSVREVDVDAGAAEVDHRDQGVG